MSLPHLPIDDLLGDVVASLHHTPCLVLTAPPGAGKTTRVPPALLSAGLAATGGITVLEPRRLAARLAAARVAREQGWRVGEEVGFRIRHQARVGPRTRLTFVTEGILTRRLQEDPLLDGVQVVILDEFHERSLQVDLALALVREVQQEVRHDLRIVAMSATLDPGPLAAFLGDCPVLQAAGRLYPVDAHFLDRPDDRPLARQIAAAVARAIRSPQDDGGDVLTFLPGAAEIRRAAEALDGLARKEDLDVLPLHGEMPMDQQDRALTPGQRRKVILSTNVAESSLTIEGVTTVVDSGQVRELFHDPRYGLDRLRTRPISKPSAAQRAGRAGRTCPGRVYRLWTRGEHHARAARDLPEIRRVDLTMAVLQIRAWGSEARRFGWFEPPPEASLTRAEELLRLLGAVDAGGVTALGRTLARLPVHPRLGRMLARATELGCPRQGAWLAALCAERDVLQSGRAFGGAADEPTGPSDLLLRLERLQSAQKEGLEPAAVRAVQATASQLARLATHHLQGPVSTGDPAEETLLQVLLAGFPDRVGARRDLSTDRLVLVGGRTARLDPRSVVRDAPLVVAHVVDDSQREARVRQASRITVDLLKKQYGSFLETGLDLKFDPREERVRASQWLRYRGLVLQERAVPVSDRQAAGILLGEAAADAPRAALAFDADAKQLLGRLRFMEREVPELDLPRHDEAALGELARELSLGRISFGELRQLNVGEVLRSRLTRSQIQALEREAPERLTMPSGSRVRVDYTGEGPPVLAVKLQELFGQRETPRLARGRVAVLIHLLAPSGRPVQVTADLESFWRNGYPEVRRELRGRYPKHPWPGDPFTARPTRRTKKR